MYTKIVPFLALAATSTLQVQAQELTKKIPANAQFVVTFNNKAIIEQNSLELLTTSLAKFGATQDTVTANKILKITNLLHNDINLEKQSYVYRTVTDSLYHIGALLPLKPQHQLAETLFSKFNALSPINGYERRISKDGKILASWNKESLLILTGGIQNGYFEDEEVAKRYGLDITPYYSADDYAESDTAYAAEGELEEAVEAEETVEEAESFEAAEAAVEAAEAAVEAAEEATWITLETDEDAAYQLDSLTNDSLYTAYLARQATNDSLKNNLLVNWLASDFQQFIDPAKNLAANKQIVLNDSKNLVRFWFSNLDDLYKESLPYGMLSSVMGMSLENLQYGYKEATLDIIQDKNKLKFAAIFQVDDELYKDFKSIYSNKANKKFKQYIPQDILAYASINASTESYLKSMPNLINRWYAPLTGEYAEVVEIGTTALQIALDEKAISKVFRGDNVFYLNGLKKVDVTYTDYIYDDDYNYEEVTKTKQEYVPNFLWIASSEDQRLFKKMVEFGTKKSKITVKNGVYSLPKTSNLEALHIVFKKDLVFVGSDEAQIQAIHENRFQGSKDAQIIKDIYKHPFNLVINASKIPTVARQLEIPVSKTWENTMEELAGYGQLRMHSALLKKNKFYGELSLELPKKDKNAMEYILKQLISTVDTNDN